MASGRERATSAACVLAAALAAALAASPAAGSRLPGHRALDFGAPTLFPRFNPRVHDYVVRCHGAPVTVHGHARGRWRLAVGRRRPHSGDLNATVSSAPGKAFMVTAKRARSSREHRFHVRCLPDDFPRYTFERYRRVHPRYFTVNLGYYTNRPYAIVFDGHGVPVWWDQTLAKDPRVLPSGRMLWSFSPFGAGRWEIHDLDGDLVRRLNTVGSKADNHDLQLLGHGRYIAGTQIERRHVDTSAYGGSPDSTVIDAELQAVAPDRHVEWRWDSGDHVSLAETGRNWRFVSGSQMPGYDVAHWNSVEPNGRSVVASFRHFDAVYKIRKRTGNIVWKLGGTRTSKSLRVEGDPHPYTFGNQHDARVLPDGTISVFDNRTNVTGPPRAARYRIDPQRGTARLVEQVTDPAVDISYWGGSARRLPGGDWLIDWGYVDPIGGYAPDGKRTFLLTPKNDASYRAEPVPPGALSPALLRRAMRAMYSESRGRGSVGHAQIKGGNARAIRTHRWVVGFDVGGDRPRGTGSVCRRGIQCAGGSGVDGGEPTDRHGR